MGGHFRRDHGHSHGARYDRPGCRPGTRGIIEPTLFVVIMLPGLFIAPRIVRRWLPDPQDVQAIYGVALLFAASHSFAWPSPVPLFPLGIALGYLAYRTQSLVAPIVLHTVFNSIGVLELLK